MQEPRVSGGVGDFREKFGRILEKILQLSCFLFVWKKDKEDPGKQRATAGFGVTEVNEFQIHKKQAG